MVVSNLNKIYEKEKKRTILILIISIITTFIFYSVLTLGLYNTHTLFIILFQGLILIILFIILYILILLSKNEQDLQNIKIIIIISIIIISTSVNYFIYKNRKKLSIRYKV